jgi:hypothetical protein
MSGYIPYQVTLTDSQKQHLSQALKTKLPVTLRLSFSQLQNGGFRQLQNECDTLGLTRTQIKKIEKHKSEKKGIEITLSQKQVSKQGGFIGSFLLNAAKAILPSVGISALEGLTSGLVNKFISGNKCRDNDYNEFAKQLLPHLVKSFSEDQKNAVKEGGFIVPLVATLASALLPTIVNLVRGKGYQVRPPTGRGYQVRPPKNYLTTP